MGSLWLRLFKAGFGAAGAPAGEFALGAIEALLAANAEDAEILRRTEGKVDDLLHGPLQAGLDWLDSARQPHRTSDERALYIERAKVSFVDAQAQMRGHTKAVSQVYVAVTYVLTGHAADSKVWLGRARETADRSIVDAVERARDLNRLLVRGHLFRRRRNAAAEALREVERSSPLVDQVGVILELPPIEWSFAVKVRVNRSRKPGSTGAPPYVFLEFRRNEQRWETALPPRGERVVDATRARIGGQDATSLPSPGGPEIS